MIKVKLLTNECVFGLAFVNLSLSELNFVKLILVRINFIIT